MIWILFNQLYGSQLQLSLIPTDYMLEFKNCKATLFTSFLNVNVTNEFDNAISFNSYHTEIELKNSLAQIPCQFKIRKQMIYRQTEQVQETFNAGWYLDRIDQPNLPLDDEYHFNYTGKGTNIYIIDSGVLLKENPELGTRVSMPWSAPGIKETRTDCTGHGSHVASIAAGKNVGVAKLATVFVLRVLNGCTTNEAIAKEEDIVAALEWLNKHAKKPAVINMSLGPQSTNSESFEPSLVIDAAARKLLDKDIQIITAAGNDNRNSCNGSPSSIPEVITVGSTERDDSRSSFSNYGSCISIFAPGREIVGWAFDLKNSSEPTYITKDGTSQSAPLVTGAIALLLEMDGALTLKELKAKLLKNAVSNKVTNSLSPVNGSKLLQIYYSDGGTGENINIDDTVFPSMDKTPWIVKNKLYLIIGISIGVAVLLLIIGCIIWRRKHRKNRNSFIQHKSFQRPPPQTITNLNSINTAS